MIRVIPQTELEGRTSLTTQTNEKSPQILPIEVLGHEVYIVIQEDSTHKVSTINPEESDSIYRPQPLFGRFL